MDDTELEMEERDERTVCVYLYVMCVYIDDGMDTMHDERDAIGYVCMCVYVCVCVCGLRESV